MVDDSAIITTLGDDECDNCVEEKKKFSDLKGNLSYEYVDVHSDRGQKLLEERGVKEGDHVDIPITTIKKCEIVKGDDGKEEKKCSEEKEFKDSYLEKIQKGEIPDDL